MYKVIQYINENLSIDDEYKRVFGTEIPSGKFFCPFHDNKNTPSAKRYGNGIKCFGKCQHFYSVYEFIKRFNPNRINEVKSSVLISDRSYTNKNNISRINVDRSKSILTILKEICK